MEEKKTLVGGGLNIYPQFLIYLGISTLFSFIEQMPAGFSPEWLRAVF